MVDMEGIASRLAHATPGPWQRHGANVHAADGSRLFEGRDGSADIRAQADRDAELVAHASEDIGALLDEVSRLTAEQAVGRGAPARRHPRR